MPRRRLTLLLTLTAQRQTLAAIRGGGVHALAHITGGGLSENLPRVLPDGLGARIDLEAWSLPPVFRWMAEVGGLDQAEMLRTFNSGIGMVLVVAKDRARDVIALLQREGDTVAALGEVIEGDGVEFFGNLL